MAESFKRYEKKYLLKREQFSFIKDRLKEYVDGDVYREYDLLSVYYDNDNDELIRRSIEKPKYKEKLRIRAYVPPKDDDLVMVELKKKYDGIVYKRRTKAVYKEVLNDIYDCQFTDEQIGNEIRYFLDYYGNLRPRIFIGAHRTSYIGKEDKTLRITFDEDMVYRMKDVSLKRSDDDSSINDGIIMEIKVNNSLPLWLVRIMDEAGAYPQAFSKVGKSYLKEKEKEYGII